MNTDNPHRKKESIRTDRLFKILSEILLNPGKKYRVKDLEDRFQVSDRAARQYLISLENYLNKPARKDYLIRSGGFYYGNFPNAVAKLDDELLLYLFLAMKHVEIVLKSQQSYEKLQRYLYFLLREEDREKFQMWEQSYLVREFAMPIQVHHYYSSLTQIFNAMATDNRISFTYRKGNMKYRVYFDPYLVHYSKHTYYVIGEVYQDYHHVKAEMKGRLIHYRLDRMKEIKVDYSNKKKTKVRSKYKFEAASRLFEEMFEAERNYEGGVDYEFLIHDEKVYNRIKEKQWHVSQRISQYVLGKGGTIRFSQIASRVEMKKWVLGWGSAIQVIQPKWLKEDMKAEIERMKKMYES